MIARQIAAKYLVASMATCLSLASSIGFAQEERPEAQEEPVLSEEGPWPEEDQGPRDEEAAAPADEAAAPPPESTETVDVIPVPQPAELPPPTESSATTLDEITVTAQKREQRVQDVPLSISVFSDKFIAEYGITDVRELMLFVPNMKVETGSTLGSPRCRGFGLNIRNVAFEPPCGVAIDGVPYTASDYFNLALFDVQRVEVMRGPQGTTFGKNTTAGVINVITKSPMPVEDIIEGTFGVQVGEFERRRGEAAFDVSFLEGAMNLRVAGLLEEQRGYMENTTAAIVPGAVEFPLTRKRDGVRGKLAFPDLFGSKLLVTYENTKLLTHGFGGEAFDVSEEMADYIRDYDPAADFERGNFITSLDYSDVFDIQIETYQMDWGAFLGGWTISAVAAHSTLDRFLGADADYFPVPAIVGTQGFISPTSSFELRAIPTAFEGLYGLQDLFGADLGTSELLAGVFYQKRELNDGLLFLQGDDPHLLNMLAIDGGASPSPDPPPGIPRNETIHSYFEQESTAVAGFAELQWYFVDRWMLQWGMRYSLEDKSATWNQALSDPHPVLTAAGWGEFQDAQEHSERQFLPKAALNYKPWDNISLFVRWTRGYKGGGFNAFSQTGQSELTSLTFGPESGEEWAFDAKMELFDNTAVNFSVFRLDVKDFQYLVQVDDPVTEFPTGNTVVNVGHARSQGVEGDVTWIPSDWLRVIATIGYNDTTFVDFPFNSCPQDETNNDGDDDPRCDVSGRPFPLTPKLNNTLSVRAKVPVADIIGFHLAGTHVGVGFTIEQIGKQYLNPDLNERSLQDSFLRYRASLGFSNEDQGWSFNVTGENLTNEVTSQREDAILGVIGSYPEPRRTIYSQFQIDF